MYHRRESTTPVLLRIQRPTVFSGVTGDWAADGETRS
jgi:hypothetical protein